MIKRIAYSIHVLTNLSRMALLVSKPMMRKKMLHTWWRAVIQGRMPLRRIEFAVSYACNLCCDHCYIVALRDDRRALLATETYANIADQAAELGAYQAAFTGGEPLLCDRLETIIWASRPHRFQVSVVTNGILLTSEYAEQLSALGVDQLVVSLDSAIPEEHDVFRGQSGAHQQAMQAIRLARRKGLAVRICAVATHATLHGAGLQGLCDMAMSQRIGLRLVFPVCAGRWRSADDTALNREDLAYIEDLGKRSPYIRTEIDDNIRQRGCGGAKELLHITPYGDVLACPCVHAVLGNVREESLAVIRERALCVSDLAAYPDHCPVSNDPAFAEKVQRDLPGFRFRKEACVDDEWPKYPMARE